MAMGAGGCLGDDIESSPEAGGEVGQLRLGRVHVVLEPQADAVDAVDSDDSDFDEADALEITARFAFVQGFEEDFARARVDIPRLPSEVIMPGQCVVTDQLTAVEAPDPSSAELQELQLVDAGNLSVRMAGQEVEVPLSLVPDLLPYMHGVEYLYYGDELPTELPDGGRVVVEAQGSQTEELPPFSAEGLVPAALALHVTEVDLAELSRDALVLRWQGHATTDDADENITVRLSGLQGGEPVGNELTCVLSDVGQTRLAFDALRPLGLMLDTEALSVTASRLQSASFDAGDFTGSELFVERRETLVLPLH